MGKKLTCIVLLFSGFLVLGCGSISSSSQKEVIREAGGISMVFEAPLAVVLGDNSCKNPLRDPVDGALTSMIRSFGNGMADYKVPDGRYEVGKGELLRANFKPGEAVGIVEE